MRFTARPLLHFVLLGGLLFAARTATFGAPQPPAEVEPVVVTRARIDELRQDWQARTGAPPDAPTLSALIEQEIDDLLLVREARARGLHRSDPVVQQRLLRNMEFLEDPQGRSAGELLDEAYRLGLDRSDLVVRRRLVQTLTLEAHAGARTPEVTEAELRAYRDAHAEEFRVPARARISHVYLSRDRRGDALAADARSALARLRAAGPPGPDTAGVGDPFLFPSDLGLRSEAELARTFGSGFAAGVADLPVGRWAGPVESAYGAHLVWVHERAPEAAAPLRSVRTRLTEAVYAERGEVAFRAALAALRARTPVRVEAEPVP